MKVSSRLFVSPARAIALIAAVTIAIIILFTANITITNAQQQPPPTSEQPAVTQQNPTLVQSTRDSFRVQVPEGWVTHDMKNTGFTLLAEVFQGYGILAQLCPEEQQQAQALPNVGSSGTYRSSSCQQAREEE